MRNQEIKTNFDRNDYGKITFSAFATAPENYLRDLQKDMHKLSKAGAYCR